MNERDYLLTDWRKYSILVESEYERKNEMLDYLRTIRFEIRANNVYLKDEHRPKSYDDIYKLIPYKDLGKKEKKKDMLNQAFRLCLSTYPDSIQLC